MRAVAVDAFGATPRIMDLPKPAPAAGELLVQMAAAGLNPFDGKIADGILKDRPHVFPLILGVDGAGTVEALGEGAHRFHPGDRIFGEFLHDPVGTGTYAEYAVVPERIGVVRTPEALSDLEAAGLPMSGMTALDALDRLDLESGNSLLVVGASGGIGSFALPLAHARGVRVIAIARATSAERMLTLGASEVVDANLPDWIETVQKRSTNGVDAVLDLMSKPETFRRVLTLVRPGGRAASTVYAADASHLKSTEIRAFNINLQPTSKLLERVTRQVLDGGIKIPIERTISLEGAPAALSEIRAGKGAGKTVVDISAGR